jgi:hypothetical protein
MTLCTEDDVNIAYKLQLKKCIRTELILYLRYVIVIIANIIKLVTLINTDIIIIIDIFYVVILTSS